MSAADHRPPEPDEALYRSRQFGTVTVLTLGGSAVLCGLLAVPLAAAGVWAAAAVLGWCGAFCLVLLPFFWDITIRVTTAELRWRVGIGPLGRRLPLGEIERIAPAWVGPAGWGVQKMPGGWSYVLTGREAVDILLRGGGRVRLGTPDPEGLAAAVAAAGGGAGGL